MLHYHENVTMQNNVTVLKKRTTNFLYAKYFCIDFGVTNVFL